LDSSQLERLSALTRSLTTSTASPLLRLYYWTVFLDLYLKSGIRSPVYLEDALPAILGLLERAAKDLVDPELKADLERLAASPLLPETKLTATFRHAVAVAARPHELNVVPMEEPELQAWILLVPDGPELLGHRPKLAVPALLSVRASRGFRKPGDVVWRIARQEHDPIEAVASHALAAARLSTGNGRPTLSYEIRLQRADWHLRGSSLGLALAVLFYAFEAAEKRRQPRVVASDVAILGSVDEHGSVVPVAAATLPQKIRAVFGAGLCAVALPVENLPSAQDELRRLKERFPRREPPRLVGVRTLAELLDQEELFVRPAQPIRGLVARVRTPRIWAAVVLAFLVLGCAYWFRPRTWLPENTRIDPGWPGSKVVTVRLAGFPPHERHWRFDTAVGAALLDSLPPRSRAVLLVGTNPNGLHPANLFCYDLNSPKLLWSRDLSDLLDLPEPTRSTVSMQIPEIITTDLDNDGRRDVIAVAQANPMSPCFVYWLRDDGSTRSIYAHRGYLFEPQAVDFEQDGKSELFLKGTSNFDGHMARWPSLKQNATLVVLDRDHFAGWPGDGPFEGSTRAPFDSCLARVVFPPIPEHCRILNSPGYLVKSCIVRASATDPIVLVKVGWDVGPGLVVTLGRDFRPVRVVAEDDLGPVVQKALESGEIHEDFTTPERLQPYLQEIKRVR
jgi:hypothetical protein